MNKRREWLYLLREQLGLTQEDVAKSISIERSTYAKAELGYSLSVDTAKKIASFYEIDWAIFFEQRVS